MAAAAGADHSFGHVPGRSETGIHLAEAVVISGGRVPRPQHILVDRLAEGRFVQLDPRASWLTMLVAGTSHTRCAAPIGDLISALAEACLAEHFSAEIHDDPVLALEGGTNRKLPPRPNGRTHIRAWQACTGTYCKPWISRVSLSDVLAELGLASGFPDAESSAPSGNRSCPGSRTPSLQLHASFRCSRHLRARAPTGLHLAVAADDLKHFVSFLDVWASSKDASNDSCQEFETPTKQRKKNRERGHSALEG